MNAARQAGSEDEGEGSAVALAGVRFRWPGAERDVLAIDALSIERGERVFVRGPSGSGKSTLLNLIGAVAAPREGRIRVDGVVLDSLSGGARDAFRAERIGFVFQLFNLLPFLDLVDNVLLPCRFSAARSARARSGGRTLEAEARRLLGNLGLDAATLARRSVTELSVGQQQRVAAARALIGSPPLVVADEPTSALDSDARHAFVELLFREVRAAHATLVFVSHDRELEAGFDRVIDLPGINAAAVDAVAPIAGQGSRGGQGGPGPASR